MGQQVLPKRLREDFVGMYFQMFQEWCDGEKVHDCGTFDLSLDASKMTEARSTFEDDLTIDMQLLRVSWARMILPIVLDMLGLNFPVISSSSRVLTSPNKSSKSLLTWLSFRNFKFGSSTCWLMVRRLFTVATPSISIFVAFSKNLRK